MDKLEKTYTAILIFLAGITMGLIIATAIPPIDETNMELCEDFIILHEEQNFTNSW